MDHTYVDEKSLKTLEDYAVILAGAMLSLKTLQNFQVRALEIGIMPEDMNEIATTIIWDLRRLINLYKGQIEATFELIPDDFNAQEIIKKMKAGELTKARSMTRKPKVKE
jgi:hypothetical protein